MNWYRLAQLNDVEILEDDSYNTPYTNIGHYKGGRFKKENPNYIWYFFNGEIMSEPETEKGPNHTKVFPEYELGLYYAGRFESSTKRLSIRRPFRGKGIAQLRPVPQSILYKLYQKFPGVKQIYVF